MSQNVLTPFDIRVPIGTPPISCVSPTTCPGLGADLLDGLHGVTYLDRANHTGTQAASTIVVTPTGNLSAATASAAFAELQGDIDLLARGISDGRLTTETGVGVSESDRTLQSTIRYTPFIGSRIGLYDGTRWGLHSFTERSLALSGLTSGKNYDVFLYNNAGTLTLELSAAWTDDITRANALTLQDGVYVKSGSTTRRWLGTIRTTSTTTTEDSENKRFVWNFRNQWPRPWFRTAAGGSHSYDSTTIRYWANDATNQLEVVCGLPQTIPLAGSGSVTAAATGVAAQIGIGVNGVGTSAAAEAQPGTTYGGPIAYTFKARLGYSTATMCERGTGNPTTSHWYFVLGGMVNC